MRTSPTGIELIKDFEGLKLKAYPDPGTGGDPWTVGYGHTGPEVKPGLVIDIEQAGELLKKDLRTFENAVDMLVTVELNQHEFDALVSFAYNCGAGALGDSTLRRRLNAGEDKCPVFQQELPRWVNGGNGPMPGLVRRREAEAELACTPVSSSKKSFLEDAALYYNEEKHQREAWRSLEATLSAEVLEAFKAAYRGQGVVEEPVTEGFPLQVQYFYQLDSKTGHGERSCFSSSMSMALEYVDPVKFDGMDDDDYLMVVFKYGDTVSSTAQVQAAESLGYKVEFHTNGTEQDLLNQLDKGVPIPIGILHKGSVDNPTGGGHYVVLIGYDNEFFHVHDPFGQLDVINGGYTIDNGPVAGRDQRYSRKNLIKRWLIDGSGSDGWWMEINPS